MERMQINKEYEKGSGATNLIVAGLGDGAKALERLVFDIGDGEAVHLEARQGEHLDVEIELSTQQTKHHAQKRVGKCITASE